MLIVYFNLIDLKQQPIIEERIGTVLLEYNNAVLYWVCISNNKESGIIVIISSSKKCET